MVDSDPERALHDLGPYMLHQVNEYIEYGFLEVPRFEDPQVLVDQGFYTFVDAAGAIAYFGEAAEAGVQEIQLFGLVPGEPVESATKRLAYVAEHVAPAFSGPLVAA